MFCEVQLEPLTGKNDPPPGFKTMVVQFNWAKDVTLEEVERFRRRYATSYNLNECAMMVNSVRPGSFTVTWFVAVSTIRGMAERKDVELFAEFNVITLVIDGTCAYVSPAQLPLLSFTPPLSLIVSCFQKQKMVACMNIAGFLYLYCRSGHSLLFHTLVGTDYTL